MSGAMQSLTKEQIGEVIQLFNPYMDDYLYIMDLQNDSYRISEHAVERFMLPGAAFQNALEKHKQFVYAEDLPLLDEDFELMLSGQKTAHNLHYRWLDRSGKPVWINCRGGVVTDEDGQPRYLIGCINETGKKQRADNTSGLLGELELSAYILSHGKGETNGFLMRIGIDDFSSIIGTAGVVYGEYIIKSVADCIHECLTAGQQLFHIVADEYMIVDFGEHTSEDAILLYKSIQKKILEFIDRENYKCVFTVSAGILGAALMQVSYEEILKLSDFTMKQTKENGKNNFYVFNQEEYDRFLRKREITMALYHAADNAFSGFEVYYQPIVDCVSNKILGAEALMRFSIQKDGVIERISPLEFIPLLEETGLILPAGRWILNEAAAMCSEMQKTILGFKININISYIQVMKGNVLKDILAVMKRYQLAPECIGIELTESGYLDSNPHFVQLREGLEKNGIQFIIDDFGTGYSNLHCLSDLSPTYIKIDKDFTNKAMCNTYDHELMIKIIEMAHSLSLQICVEGVEKTETLEELKKIHADYIQGYLFGKPCSKKEFYENFIE